MRQVCSDVERRDTCKQCNASISAQLFGVICIQGGLEMFSSFATFRLNSVLICYMQIQYTGQQLQQLKTCPPVLMILWMTFATWPLRRELSSLTRSSRQVQRTAKEAARRISPTVRSDRPVETNKCRPVQ